MHSFKLCADCAESQYLTALRPVPLHIVFAYTRTCTFLSLAITKSQSLKSLAENVSRAHCRCCQYAATGVRKNQLRSHKPDRSEPATSRRELNCCAPWRRNYVQRFADDPRPMPHAARLGTGLPTRSAHSFKLCIGVESGPWLDHIAGKTDQVETDSLFTMNRPSRNERP